MKLNIKASGLELTPAISDYIQEKMSMLDKYLGDLKVIQADFEVELTTKHHLKGEIFRAEANLSVPGDLLRTEKTEKDLYKAIDKVKDHLQDMIIKNKEKILNLKRQ